MSHLAVVFCDRRQTLLKHRWQAPSFVFDTNAKQQYVLNVVFLLYKALEIFMDLMQRTRCDLEIESRSGDKKEQHLLSSSC